MKLASPNFSRRSRKASTSPSLTALSLTPILLFVRMLGYDSKEDLLSKRVPDVFTDHAERKSLMEEVERQPSPQGREINLIRKDGTAIVCLNAATAVRDTSGKVLRYQGSVLDVTARRQMERQLHKQEFARAGVLPATLSASSC